MTRYIKVDIYCPVCGSELHSEYEDYRDVVFVGKNASILKPSLYLVCDDCGWYVKDKEALQQVQNAIVELER